MTPAIPAAGPARRDRLLELARLFLRLGLVAFGGPAAHIGMFHDEVVNRRGWLDDREFLDLLGATNLIPGPNSTEMTIHIGYARAGWPGLIVAGSCFILPAMLMVMGLAALYVAASSTPQADWLLYGVKPVVIAIIAQALWLLGRKAVTDKVTALAAAAVIVLYALGGNELALLFATGLAVMLVRNWRRGLPGRAALLPVGAGLLPTLAAAPFSLPLLFLTFLKIGAVLYGSGYVLFAFVHADFVARLGWLSDRQLVDAIAIGQVTPGPVFTSATFIGYLLGGWSGSLLATIAIFLPAFVFVAFSHPLIPRLRASPWAGGLLDGVNVASLGLMATVTWQLGRAAVVDPLTALLALLSALLLFRYRINTTWLILGGALLGLARWLLG